MIKKLMTIYPQSLFNPSQSQIISQKDYYLIENEKDKLYIPIASLNKKEKELLKLLANKYTVGENASPLEKMLNQGVIDEVLIGQKSQLLYLKVTHLDVSNQALWIATLKDSITNIINGQIISNQLVVFLLKLEKDDQSVLSQLQEITQSLDQDFNSFTQGMIGQMTYLNRQIKDIFSYELTLFESVLLKHRVEGITTISEALLRQMGLELQNKKPKLLQLENYLSNKVETKDFIQRLYSNQGNLSQTADELFIHRNTLAYRVKQFYQQTGFDLSDFSDLIVCYLLIL